MKIPIPKIKHDRKILIKYNNVYAWNKIIILCIAHADWFFYFYTNLLLHCIYTACSFQWHAQWNGLLFECTIHVILWIHLISVEVRCRIIFGLTPSLKTIFYNSCLETLCSNRSHESVTSLNENICVLYTSILQLNILLIVTFSQWHRGFKQFTQLVCLYWYEISYHILHLLELQNRSRQDTKYMEFNNQNLDRISKCELRKTCLKFDDHMALVLLSSCRINFQFS